MEDRPRGDMDNRTVIIVSGLPYSGKSTLVKDLHSTSRYAKATVFSQDKFGHALYGGREDSDITMAEHRFKNEWMRYEILRSLILGTGTVIVDSVMLTIEQHQLPILEMLARAEKYIQEINRERGIGPTAIHLKVILCFSTPEVIESRALHTSQDDRKKYLSPVFDLSGMRRAYDHFEFPNASTYEPLYLDTSDTSTEAQPKRLGVIDEFVQKEIVNKALNESQKQTALTSYQAMYSKIKVATA